MKSTEILWHSGSVVYWDMDQVNEEQPPQHQSEQLKEDLVQIEYPNGVLLDIGWYPSFDPSGEFIVSVIRNGNWELPLFRAAAKDFQSLRQQIINGISEIRLTSNN